MAEQGEEMVVSGSAFLDLFYNGDAAFCNWTALFLVLSPWVLFSIGKWGLCSYNRLLFSPLAPSKKKNHLVNVIIALRQSYDDVFHRVQILSHILTASVHCYTTNQEMNIDWTRLIMLFIHFMAKQCCKVLGWSLEKEEGEEGGRDGGRERLLWKHLMLRYKVQMCFCNEFSSLALPAGPQVLFWTLTNMWYNISVPWLFYPQCKGVIWYIFIINNINISTFL